MGRITATARSTAATPAPLIRQPRRVRGNEMDDASSSTAGFTSRRGWRANGAPPGLSTMPVARSVQRRRSNASLRSCFNLTCAVQRNQLEMNLAAAQRAILGIAWREASSSARPVNSTGSASRAGGRWHYAAKGVGTTCWNAVQWRCGALRNGVAHRQLRHPGSCWRWSAAVTVLTTRRQGVPVARLRLPWRPESQKVCSIPMVPQLVAS